MCRVRKVTGFTHSLSFLAEQSGLPPPQTESPPCDFSPVGGGSSRAQEGQLQWCFSWALGKAWLDPHLPAPTPHPGHSVESDQMKWRNQGAGCQAHLRGFGEKEVETWPDLAMPPPHPLSPDSLRGNLPRGNSAGTRTLCGLNLNLHMAG